MPITYISHYIYVYTLLYIHIYSIYTLVLYIIFGIYITYTYVKIIALRSLILQHATLYNTYILHNVY